MAHAALSSLAHVIEEILPNSQKYKDLCSKEKFISLLSDVILLQNFLEDFHDSMVTKQLEHRIRGLAYKLGDTIEYITSTMYLIVLSGPDNGDTVSRCRQICSTFGRRIDELNSIVEETLKIKNSASQQGEAEAQSSSLVNMPSVSNTNVGLDEHLIRIRDRLTSDLKALQIIPIVGMGGIGKTTLARIAYEKITSTRHFDFFSWVTVSQQYDVKKILIGIFLDVKAKIHNKSLSESEYNRLKKQDVESLIHLVYQSLFGRRFLIVMDDIWHLEVWDGIRRALRDDDNGSRVILTSRLQDVATKVSPGSPLHQLQLLTEDQSWKLFQEKAFDQEYCAPELEDIAKAISRNCKGLPLAIVVIARLLKLNVKCDYWEKFAINIQEAAAASHDDELFEILSLSYNNLPPHLKSCFIQMGIFPEDYEIHTERLFRLWIAEGFLKKGSNQCMEEVAEEYLGDLVERNLVQVTKKRYNGRIKTCSIHDVLRELSLRKAEEEITFLRYHRRVSISRADHTSLQDDIMCEAVRSLQFFHPCTRMYLPIRQFRILRVLDAIQVKMGPSVFNMLSLISLRYLAFTFMCQYCHELESICNLKNLETLIIGYCPSIYRPSNPLLLNVCILTLPKLRHFVLIGKYTEMYSHLDALRSDYPIPNSLQTLSGVNNLIFTPGVIARFANLRKLKIRYREMKLEYWEGICLGNIVNLQHLEELNFNLDEPRSTIPILLPTNIAFPPSLIKITLTRSGISWDEMSVIGSLPNLEVLKLMRGSFIGKVWEPVEGEFLMLKYLKLEVEDLVHWMADSSHFPSLEQLIVSRCYKLKKIPNDIGNIDTLQKLVVLVCNNVTEASAKAIQDEQRSYSNHLLEVFVQRESKKKM